MKQPHLLKRFEYSVPSNFQNTVNGYGGRKSQLRDMHLPQVNVSIDFETKTLLLEGNSGLMVPAVQKPKLKRSARNYGRISVNAAIQSGVSFELADLANDELVYSLDGTINDGESITSCSGLLMLDSEIKMDGTGGREWCLYLYLYDDFNVEREIKLKLAMYSVSDKAQLN